MESRPIFIGGLSFTGKTQLRMMLSAHPDILIARRTHLWDRFYGRFGDLGEPKNFERCLEAMLAAKPIQELAPNLEQLRREFAQGPATYERLFAGLHAQNAARAGKKRWGDQLGFIERYADRIFAAYPSARMIQMVRDPGTRSGESRETSHRLVGRIGWETAQWLRSAQLAKRHQERYPGRYLVVQYEQLFTRPEETLRRICDFLEEEFQPEMLDFGEIEAHAVNGGHVLMDRDLHFIRSYAGEAMKSLGYGYDDLRLSWHEWLSYGLGLPINLTTLMAGALQTGAGQRETFQRNPTV
jgi:hypothetical protein